MSTTIRPGDTVALNSGGPPLVVLHLLAGEDGQPTHAVCGWLDSALAYRNEKFPLACVRLVRRRSGWLSWWR